MRANRGKPVSVSFWFQSTQCRPHGGLLHSQEEFVLIVYQSQKNGAIRPRFGLALNGLLLAEALDPADAEFAWAIHRDA